MAHHQPIRLFPSTPGPPTTTALSILDNTVARFSPTGAIWVFDTYPSLPRQAFLSQLQTSFTKALSSFPHFAGQLHWDTSTRRFNRAAVTCGSPSDPGVEYTVVASSRDVSIPKGTIWEGTFPQDALLASQTPLALHDLKTADGLPAMIVQITLLPQGYAVAVKLAHPLADAHTLLLFMRHWSAAHAARPPPTTPAFAPRRLDEHAAGPTSERDDALTAQARALPLHRFDWWATDAPAYPPFLAPTTANSRPTAESLLAAKEEALRKDLQIPPWATWDLLRPVKHAVLHFADAALGALRVDGASRLDALLAHVWARIVRARGLVDEDVFLDVTLGVRARTEPPLGDDFVGSPLVLAHVGLAAREVVAGSAAVAAEIRRCLQRFTPDAVGAVLHDAKWEVSPQRIWQAFLGERHVLVTAWLRIGVYEVELFGARPAWVHSVMPRMDGCVQVMEGREGGMDVSVYLEAQAMDRLLADRELGV
ncbi:Acyltransferase AFT15-1 like protein [Verticillium longisporum]